MDRTQLLRRVDDAWHGFARACEGLPPQDLLEPGVVGQWSVKDLMGHVATWEEEALAALTLIAKGKQPPRYSRYGGIDVFNDMRWQHFRTLAIEDVQRWFTETHARLLDYLARAPEQLFVREGRFRRRLRLDTYGHIPEHTRQVRSWRRARSLGGGESVGGGAGEAFTPRLGGGVERKVDEC